MEDVARRRPSAGLQYYIIQSFKKNLIVWLLRFVPAAFGILSDNVIWNIGVSRGIVGVDAININA